MWGGTDEAQSIATIRSAIDRGVTLIHIAPVYGFGRSEEIVGKDIDAATKHDIDAVLKRCIVDPVSPAFMAPPAIRPKEQKRLAA
jgi:diketogulonate reductase-like aldo/keto reductase